MTIHIPQINTIIVIIVILAAVGALFYGGESFGDSLRKGCGCTGLIVILLLLLFGAI